METLTGPWRVNLIKSGIEGLRLFVLSLYIENPTTFQFRIHKLILYLMSVLCKRKLEFYPGKRIFHIEEKGIKIHNQ